MPKHLSTLDLLGLRYGRLVIISDLGLLNHIRHVMCKCDCGNIKEYRLNGLRMGHSKSCGCFRRDFSKSQNKTHGLSKHPLFTVWMNIRQRCCHTYHKQYVDYGGRGISICKEWDNSFKSFYDWCIENGYRKGLTVDRRIMTGTMSRGIVGLWINSYKQEINEAISISQLGALLSALKNGV